MMNLKTMKNNTKLRILLIPTVSNPEFQMLADALTQSGCKVYTDINEFWHPTRNYDVLHTQFPESLNGFSKKRSPSKEYASELRIIKQLTNFKDLGIQSLLKLN